MATRRGFLKFLGKGGLAGVSLAAPVAGYTLDVDKGKDVNAFNFTCTCGEGMVAKVPKERVKIEMKCECGNVWSMEWAGDHFKTKLMRHGPNQDALASEDVDRWWTTIRYFDYEAADQLTAKTIQLQLEARHRSDGIIYYFNHIIRDGKTVGDWTYMWETFRTEAPQCPPSTPQEFHEEFSRQMKRLNGVEVFV